MKQKKGAKRFLIAFHSFFTFFLLVAFVTTCCLMLFIRTLVNTLGITLTSADISAAAKITMVNVILISLGFYLVDCIRRKIAIDRPVNEIISATEKMIAGDFSIRIKPSSKLITYSKFNEITECINKMAQELSGVETLRTDFISNVSHEMKTPLSVMQNYSRLLQDPGLPAEKRTEYAKAITEASRRLSDMMTNVLKLNRLENQQIFPKAEEYNLSEQLCECFLQFENVWEEREIEIDTLIEENVTVCADAELLCLVWNNLISNAFKFTEAGGKVTLSLSADEKYATVTVSDTGCGMSPEVGAHIFEKFYQGDTSRATQGNGLGLALVKRVVDIIDGEIGVESTLGEGSSFTVKIRRTKNGRVQKDM